MPFRFEQSAQGADSDIANTLSRHDLPSQSVRLVSISGSILTYFKATAWSEPLELDQIDQAY